MDFTECLQKFRPHSLLHTGTGDNGHAGSPAGTGNPSGAFS